MSKRTFRKRRPRWCLAVLFAALVAIGVTGCNTVQGLGQDIESIGYAMEDALD